MCVFCQIAKKEIPADIVYEDDEIMAFKDINPAAPVHLLVIPKKHIQSLDHFEEADKKLLAKIFYQVKLLAQERKIAERGYKVIVNTGKDGGQIVDHFHAHLLGGGKIEKSANFLTN